MFGKFSVFYPKKVAVSVASCRFGVDEQEIEENWVKPQTGSSERRTETLKKRVFLLRILAWPARRLLSAVHLPPLSIPRRILLGADAGKTLFLQADTI